MAGTRCLPEDWDLLQARAVTSHPAPADLTSDDDRSVAADSWSIKSDYGSNIEDEQRHVDAAEVLASCNVPPTSDYSSDKEAPDANDIETSMLGLQNYWDAIYAEALANFHEHGHAGEVWFGTEVIDAFVTWTKGLCNSMPQGLNAADRSSKESESSDSNRDFSNLSVLDIGTGNGQLLHELAKQGFSDLTGTDYSQGAIDLAQNLAARDGFSYIKLLVDDILQTKLDRTYQLVTDKGTLDSIGMHPDGSAKRLAYWESVSSLVAPGGILVIASCNKTKDELVQEVEILNHRKTSSDGVDQKAAGDPGIFQYMDHLQSSHGTMVDGAGGAQGAGGSQVSIVAFRQK